MSITPLSESAVAVIFGEKIDPAIHRKVTAFRDALLSDPFPGLMSVVPAYASVTVFFDPPRVLQNLPAPAGSPCRFVLDHLGKMLDALSPVEADEENRPLIDVPVRYDGPDLAEVAGRLGLTVREIVDLHSGTVYDVYMIGFLPGFPYMGTLPAALHLPRRDTPRRRVAAGSVAIAGAQTGIYPQASPGGWHLIGHTDIALFDPTKHPPALLRPGMKIRFREID